MINTDGKCDRCSNWTSYRCKTTRLVYYLVFYVAISDVVIKIGMPVENSYEEDRRKKKNAKHLSG
jgi:hypothetical protein